MKKIEFKLNENLEQDSLYVSTFNLCQVRLINNRHYIWLILVPLINNIVHITDLSSQEQIILMQEINHVAKVLKTIYKPDRLNIGSLGNVVEQMHWHVVVRYKTDNAWPNPVWGRAFSPYTEQECTAVISKLQQEFAIFNSK